MLFLPYHDIIDKVKPNQSRVGDEMQYHITDINTHIYHHSDSIYLRNYAITPVNHLWIITYLATPSHEVRYLDYCETQQDAINRVMTELGTAN